MKKLIPILFALVLILILLPAQRAWATATGIPCPEGDGIELLLVGQKDPTCTEDGYTGDLECPGVVIPFQVILFQPSAMT